MNGRVTGPILIARGADESVFRLAALLVLPEGREPPTLVAGRGGGADVRRLLERCGRVVWRYDFALPARADAAYRLGDTEYPVAADLSADLRIAYVSCNGQENGDLERNGGERNAMWRRLAAEHAERPFGLLLQGGDQLYADEVLDAHPTLCRWSDDSVKHKHRHAWTDEVRATAERFYLERYETLYTQPATAQLYARVPSLMMWDDHDIFDGWGSHPRATLDSPVGRGLFAAASESFALFQLGWSPDEMRAAGGTLGTAARFPGFAVLAPDLRSERRPDRIMGPAGWSTLERWLTDSRPDERLLIMSSVPALGPRLSLLERLMHLVPGAQKYEDDLRDQWQSRSHRAEWKRFLLALEQEIVSRRHPVTVLSGEIHLATRGEMPVGDGATLHQLVASGIAHQPPPRAYARALGLLASLGEDPLPGRPVRLRPLPGCSSIYAAERNYLVLERRDGIWSAAWELENSGRTPLLAL